MKLLKKFVKEHKREFERINPRCPHFGKCGGCLLQDISYSDQLRLKEKFLESIGLKVKVEPSPKVWYYRNRMDYICYDGKIGLRKKGTWKEVVEIKNCKLMSEESNELLEKIREQVKKENIEFYDIINHIGYLRYVVIREGKFTGERMVTFVTNSENPKIEKVAKEIEADSVVWEINDTLSDVSFGRVKKFWGKEYITEKFGNIIYIIRPNSFFQTNPYQAKEIYDLIKKEVKGESRVLDLFCGGGGISLYIADEVKEIKGIELNEEAIKNAKESAEINGIKNVDFEVGNARNLELDEKFDVVIVDPPRAGLGKKLAKKLNKFEKIIYMSCNPISQKEDLQYLEHEVKKAYAFDMFPHTPHIETLLILEKQK